MTRLPGSDFLGHTIDILGKYADEEYTVARVITLSDLDTNKATFQGNDYTHPEQTEYSDDTGSFEMLQASGSSYRSYSEKFSVEMAGEGGYGAFSASIDAAYSQSLNTTSSSYYYSIYQTYRGYILSLTNQTLDSTVQADLDKSESQLSAEDFFKKWGTHVVTRVIGGGQLRYYASGSTGTWDSLTSFEVSARAAYNGVGGSVSVGGSQEEHVSEIQDSATLQVVGGSIAGQSSTSPTDVSQVDATEWAATIGTNPAVIAFAANPASSASGLVPIWNWCTNAARKAELETWFNDNYTPLRYTSSWQSYQDETDDKIVEVKIADLADPSKFSDSNHRLTDPEEWYVVGFGGTINSNGHMTRAGLMIENVRTEEVKGWYVCDWDGNYSFDNDASTLEHTETVPTGHAVTGLALRADDNKLKAIKLWYQGVNLGYSVHDNGALQTAVFTAGNTSRDDDEWELNTLTVGRTEQEPKATVMSGVRVSMQNNGGKLLSVQWSDFYLGSQHATYAPVASAPTWKYIDTVQDRRNKTLQTDDPDEFVVGFGGTVNNNGNSSRIAVCYENAKTGDRRWVSTDGAAYTSMERYEEVPGGCALVGLALHAKSKSLKNLVVYYQVINRDPTENGGVALMPGIYRQGDTGYSAWEADSNTAQNNVKALSGITVGIDNNEVKYLAQRENNFTLARATA